MSNRFKLISTERLTDGRLQKEVFRVVEDTETGVQYLYVYNNMVGSVAITPLLNADGTPKVTIEEE